MDDLLLAAEYDGGWKVGVPARRLGRACLCCNDATAGPKERLLSPPRRPPLCHLQMVAHDVFRAPARFGALCVLVSGRLCMAWCG
jgi:hypothetical protein